MTELIGTPDRFFYTGKPPTVLGGSHSRLLFIRPFAQYSAGIVVSHLRSI
jgi:hypothetical protein